MTDWMQHAACRGQDPSMFHPAKGEPLTEARRFCADCPVVQECLEYALADPSCRGLWGNMSERQRSAERRRRSGGASRHGPAPQEIKHGTVGGYNTHGRRKETPCQQCKDAYAAYRREAKRARKTQGERAA